MDNRTPSRAPVIAGVVFLLIGLVLAGGGIRLASLGGSWFYLLAGLGFVATAVLLWMRKPAALAVYAALAEKDAAGVVAALAGQVDGWHLAGLADAGPRGEDVAAFARRLDRTPAAGGVQHPGVPEALAAAIADAAAGGRVLVFGSFHTVEQALRALNGSL